MVSFASGLATITARPPTPPKESTTKLSDANLTTFSLNALERPLLDTPEESPSSSADYFKGSSEKAQKKVGFSPWTEYHRPLSNSGKDSDSESQIRRLRPSKECKSSNKSILKTISETIMGTPNHELQVFDQDNVPAMFRSTTLHLASTSRSSRLDAYSTLLACLNAYDDIPDIQELSENIVEITGYIRRDITSKISDEGPLDIQLATQALKALTIFVCTPAMAKCVPEDFCSFILERSISCIEDVGSPKILVAHYMQLLEKQKLGSKHMSTERVNRLLTVLEGITNRVKSNRVVGHRLMIYQRLLTQAKPVMISRIRAWIDHLVGGMLSTIKDIRARAISFGMDAGLLLGTTGSVTHACLEIFNGPLPEGKKIIEYLAVRLIEMLKSKEDSVHVPQIWSVVILFLRSRRRQLELWEHMKIWVGVIQRCFNSSDPQIKFQANIAWNRLIFAVNLDTSTSESMVKMLRQPIVSSLERKESDKNSKQVKQIARSSYCTLLYYAFRPASGYGQLNKYWDFYVAEVLPSCFAVSKTEVDYACNILIALFAGHGKPKLWEENRANVNGPVKPEELPCLDSKWVRLKTPSILHVFEKLLDAADWSIGKDQEVPIMLAWRSFMTALGNAGSKEVKVSMDSMDSIAHVFNTMKHLLDRDRLGRSGMAIVKQPNAFEKVKYLLNEAVAKVGNIPFMERRIIMTSQNSFQAAETPSSRSSRDPSSLNSPVDHLLSLLLTNVRDEQIDTSYTETIKAVMQIPLQSATTRRTQLAALRNLARLISVDNSFNTKACMILWKLLAEAASLAMRLSPHSDLHDSSPQHAGHDFREAVKLLELGIHHVSVCLPTWCELHDSIASALREEIGDEAIILIMTEPLAGLLCKEIESRDDNSLAFALPILKTIYWPQSAHLMERAQKLLWGVVHAPHKGTSVDPFDKVYSLIDALLISTYVKIADLPSQHLNELISTVTQMIKSCPSALQSSILGRLGHGLAVWIEDAKGLLGKSQSGMSADWSYVKEMWQTIMTAIQNLPAFSSNTLLKHQHLLLSSLRSRHRSIVNDSLEMWNRTFGSAESLEYPDELHLLLTKLQPVTELVLPTFPDNEGDEVTPFPFNFVESQESKQDAPELRLPTTKGSSPLAKEIYRSLHHSPSPQPPGIREAPQSAKRAGKTTPKERLRHEDPRIRFAAIESSPLAPNAVDSQHLTDRQKEVKERQANEAAAMFPEISSTSRSSSRPVEYHLPKLVLKPTTTQDRRSSVNDEASPILPPDILMNDFLGSSPTPSSSKKGKEQRYDDECPSSPPYVRPQSNEIHDVDMDLTIGDNLDTTIGEYDNHRTPIVNAESPITKGSSEARGEREVMYEVSSLLNGRLEAPASKMALVLPDERILSDQDVFVDAPAEPTGEQSMGEPEVSRVTDSFQSQKSAQSAAEDDQAAAQLISEMERASSQYVGAVEATMRSQVGTGRKRKNKFDDPPSANKKQRSITESRSHQMIAATTRPGVAVADCVMIDVREVEGGPGQNPEFKRERSPSPSIITATQFEQEIAPSRRKSGRPRRTSRVSQLSHETPSIRRSPRETHVKTEPGVDVETTPIPYSTRRSSRLSETFMRQGPRSTDGSQKKTNPAVSESDDHSNANPSKTNKSGRPRQGRSHKVSQDQDSSLDTDSLGPSTIDGGVGMAVDETRGATSDDRQASRVSQPQKDRLSLPNQPSVGLESGADAALEARDDVPTAQWILQGFKNLLHNIKQVTLGPEEERAMVGILFESVKEVHEAGRRNAAM